MNIVTNPAQLIRLCTNVISQGGVEYITWVALIYRCNTVTRKLQGRDLGTPHVPV